MKRQEYDKLEILAKALLEYGKESEKERTTQLTDLENGGTKEITLKIDLEGFTRWLVNKINNGRK